MAVETELKFRVPAQKLRSLAEGKVPSGEVGAREETSLASTYFDTPRRKLRRHGLSLRVRHNGDKHIQTIKSAPGAQFGRGEWETEIEGDVPDLSKVGGTTLKPFVSKKLRRSLKPVFETSVHRITLPIRMKASEIELVVDRGKLIAGQRATPIEELELELKKGHPDDLFRLAKSVERNAAAELYFKTKAERGYSLACGDQSHAVYAEPIELQKQMSAGEAFRIIARSTIRHFAANADAVRELDPDGIHQMRVGLRRLRAAISMFSHLLPGERTEQMKAELKWLTSELAPARELDVFVKEKINRTTNGLVPRRGGQMIEKEFAARRAEALEHARDAVNLGAVNGSQAPVRKIAADILHRRLKKLRKAGRDLEKLSNDDKHKFRIRIKKMRYAAQFFKRLFPGKRDRKQLARLSKHSKKIQDALGSLNDFVAHQKLAADTALRAPVENRRAAAFTLGVVLGRENEAVKPLMKVALKEVRGLRQIRAF